MQNVSAKRKARSASCSDYFDRALVLYRAANRRRVVDHRRKNVFLRFLYIGHVFTFFLHFCIFQTFFILKKRWQSSDFLIKQINKKHFQNNSNKIDL